MYLQILQQRIPSEGVVTHFGDDLDNRIAVEALKRHFNLHEIKVDRTPAGQPVSGRVNIDVGNSSCTEPITVHDDGTIVIDHHYSGKKNTLEILQELGIHVPRQAVELADTPAERQVDPLDWRSGLVLSRYMTAEQLWQACEKKLLTVSLTDEQLNELGLQEAATKQKEVVDNAVARVNAGVVPGTRAVIVNEFVPGGSMVAYRLGYDCYISVSPHKSGGTTFAATARPGTKLSPELIALGKEFQKKYGNGVFINPEETMIVAGGPKNPDFALPFSKEELTKQFRKTVAVGCALDTVVSSGLACNMQTGLKLRIQ